MSVSLAAGLPTSIGSLPHSEPADAVAFVLEQQPELPAAPQLPRRSARERMISQAACGIVGVSVDDDGVVVVDADALDPEAPVDTSFGEADESLVAFLEAVGDRHGPIKLQLTGPITLGLELAFAGAPMERAFAVSTAAVRARAKALVAMARARAPHAPLVVFLDEPGLGACAHGDFPIKVGDLVDMLSSGLAALGHGVVSGVHCCAETGWRMAIAAGPQVVSLPATMTVLDEAGAVASFLDGGGWIAWGAVPTTGPIGESAEMPWRRLAALWCELVDAGCEPALLRRQALVTPACGLASHDVAQAALVLGLVRTIAGRVQDQAAASRLSVGA